MIKNLAAALAMTTSIVAIATPAQAQRADFSIPAGNLADALNTYARQTGRQVLYKADEVKNARTSGVHGTMSPDAALRALLLDTGFIVQSDRSGAIAIVRGPTHVTAADPQPINVPVASAPVTSASEQSGAQIVVTGSRIARRDYRSDSPISTLDSSAIAAAGQPSLDRVIGQMPQFEAAQGAAEVGDVQGGVGFGGGASYSDLRGIGRNRSLVLMDGRRLVPSTPDGSIDLNTIPMSLIDSVEVVTGGASAAYGSDAIAGVANFKLRRTFTGLELNAQYGASTHGDGKTMQVSAILGGKFADGSWPRPVSIGIFQSRRGGWFAALLLHPASGTVPWPPARRIHLFWRIWSRFDIAFDCCRQCCSCGLPRDHALSRQRPL